MASYSPEVLAPRSSPGFDGLDTATQNFTKYMFLKKYYDSKTKTQKDKGIDPKAIMQAMAGLRQPEDVIGKEGMGAVIAGQEQQNPGMADMLDAGVSTSDAQGRPVDDNVYANAARGQMQKAFAPGFTQEQIQRKVMGLPMSSPTEKEAIPGTFKDDLKKTVDAAGGDETKLESNLKDLALQYADNRPARVALTQLIAQHKTRKSGYRK